MTRETDRRQRAAGRRAWRARLIDEWRWHDRYGAHHHGTDDEVATAHPAWLDVHADCVPIAAVPCGEPPPKDIESLDRVVHRASDQHDPPGTTEALTDNSGSVELAPDVVVNDQGEPVCVCTRTHRCAACRDGHVQGLGAFARRSA